MQIGDLTGPYVLSFVMRLGAAPASRWLLRAAAALARRSLRCRRRRRRSWSPTARWRMPDRAGGDRRAPTVRVGLVQGNVGIHEKGNVALFDINLEQLPRAVGAAAVAGRRADLAGVGGAVVGAGAGTTRLPPKHNPFVGIARVPDLRRPRLRLSASEDGEPLMYNSAFLIDGAGRVLGRYDKHVLIPFGEYIPGGSLIPGVYDLSPQTSHFTPGSDARARSTCPASCASRRSSVTRTCPPASPAR